ncbi:MAG: nucleotide exchange factor GrpE [Anaerolineae bacterium]|nr:nucleotide exchange factor GrpE [Anaerolineae bacterium]MDW8101458.1 nucleotide exchange factor GrpE [Anaerolineae bacterium]
MTEVAEEKGGENLEEKVKELEAKISELQNKVEEYLDQWRRTAADFANYRKRVEKEQAEQARYANANLIAKLLPILDDFERAFQTLPSHLTKLTWLDGIFLIHRKFHYILEQEGLKPIKTEGQFFDPFYHEAVAYEETDHYEDGQIIGEIQKGYLLHDRVLRPALVKVARKKPSPQVPEVEEKKVEEEGYAGEDSGD